MSGAHREPEAERTTPPGLMDAFRDYERALMNDDVEALDRLFAPGEQTLRGDAAGLLVGHDRIREFRRSRGGARARTIVETHVQVIDEAHALIVAVTELRSGGRGQQTQLWARRSGSWVVTAAHVSVPGPALDRRIWRIVGDPLVPADGPGDGTGELDGETVAVKDLYAVAGQRVGAGNPAWLAQADPEPAHAWAVARLLGAGASVRGIARTDEFAYSLAGTNAHYGTPPNPHAPYRISGGSSSGSAVAVALGHASIGLGTDTGGSIRVPAAYQGLWGIRTTHDVVARAGLLPLAPSFDTVGWMTREPGLLAAAGRVLLSPDIASPGELVLAADLVGMARPEVSARLADAVAGLPRIDWPLDLTAMLAAFQTLQAYEAWQVHGTWLRDRLDVLGPDVRARFEHASAITGEAAEVARTAAASYREAIRELLGDRVLALPSAPSFAPLADDPAGLDAVRQSTLLLTCIAGLGGLPAVNVPLPAPGLPPVGLSLVGPAGSDQGLIALATGFAAEI